MTPAEALKFHEYADLVWDLAKQAEDEGCRDVADALKQVATQLHAKGSGRESLIDLLTGE